MPEIFSATCSPSQVKPIKPIVISDSVEETLIFLCCRFAGPFAPSDSSVLASSMIVQ